jgi:hypothetical protein
MLRRASDCDTPQNRLNFIRNDGVTGSSPVCGTSCLAEIQAVISRPGYLPLRSNFVACRDAIKASLDRPLPFVDIELHHAFIPHFQQQGLAGFIIDDVGALFDLEGLEGFSRSAVEMHSRSFSMTGR